MHMDTITVQPLLVFALPSTKDCSNIVFSSPCVRPPSPRRPLSNRLDTASSPRFPRTRVFCPSAKQSGPLLRLKRSNPACNAAAHFGHHQTSASRSLLQSAPTPKQYRRPVKRPPVQPFSDASRRNSARR
jgi:hypothetical protein